MKVAARNEALQQATEELQKRIEQKVCYYVIKNYYILDFMYMYKKNVKIFVRFDKCCLWV